MRQDYLRLGALLLVLVSDWDAWVSRRVDSFHFAGDDERVLHRCQSVDFILPRCLTEASLGELRTFGGLPVPLTFVTKWRLPEFSLRDRSNAAVSLVQRQDSARLGAAMLVALGTFVKTKGATLVPGDDPSHRMPPGLQAELAGIAGADPPAGLRHCVDFQHVTRDRGPARLLENGWRRCLASSELFMSLAYELAVGFPLMALVPLESERTGHLLKFSYNSYVVPAEHDRWPVRIRHGLRWLQNGSRDAIDPVEWKKASSRRQLARLPPDSSATGRLVISTTCSRAAERLHHGAQLIACGIATIKGPNGRQAVRIRPSGIVAIDGLPKGRYTIGLDGKSGFDLEASHESWEMEPGKVERLHVRTRREGFARHATRAPATIARPAWLPKRWSRGHGWSSKPLAIRVRLGDGGSYHCEFEAPAGLHVTRAKLISNLDGNERTNIVREPLGDARTRARYVDTVLESTQRASLYSPAGETQPGAGYAILNLRPRAETVVRPAFFTALITLVIAGALTIGWNGNDGFGGDGEGNLLQQIFALLSGEESEPDGPPWGLLAVLLGAPSALAAYFAQAIPSRVTNAMLYGLRLTALLPVVFSLLTAGALLSSPSLGSDLVLSGVVFLTFLVCCALWVTYRFAEHPPEQKPVAYRQGPDFEHVHLEPRDSKGASSAIPEDSVSDRSEQEERLEPEAIRDRMLERIGGMTAVTRRKLFGQGWFGRWEREVPPALYFDSAESPAVFLGPGSGEQRGKLRSLVEDLVDNAPPSLDERMCKRHSG